MTLPSPDIDFDLYRDMSDEEFLALLAKEGVDLEKVTARAEQDMAKLFQAYPEAQD